MQHSAAAVSSGSTSFDVPYGFAAAMSDFKAKLNLLDSQTRYTITNNEN